MIAHDLTRRQALGAAGAMLAGSQIAPGSTAPVPGVQPAAERAGVPPRAELVNTHEYEEQAKLKLAPAVYSLIAGGDREGFDRITIRPRVLVDTLGLDLNVTLFGERLFAPIVIGPVAEQRRFHADGELATVRGAAAARTIMTVSSRSSVPLQEIAAQARTSLWYQVFAGDPALALGANAVMLGRAPRWALGAFGAPGVQRLLEIVQRELTEAAAAAGRSTLAAIDSSIVTTRFP